MPVSELNPEENLKKEDLDSMRQAIDLVADKHGPKTLDLKPEGRSWILKVHKNMGCPSPLKVKHFCQQLGCPQGILDAIPDLRCSTCAETKSQVPYMLTLTLGIS